MTPVEHKNSSPAAPMGWPSAAVDSNEKDKKSHDDPKDRQEKQQGGKEKAQKGTVLAQGTKKEAESAF
jgi:hypothetical protein